MKNLMKLMIGLLCVVLLAAPSCEKGNTDNPQPPVNTQDTVMVWNDEFNYTGLPDESKWSYDTTNNNGWGNHELEFYTLARLKNAEVKDGYLRIKAIKESYKGFNYTSARLVTKYKGDWLYGKIEVRAKLPDGRGMWPAIWMLPTDWTYGGWPNSGEIDIMENVGYNPYVIVGSVHTKTYNHTLGTQKSSTINVPTCYSGFHVYGLEWDQNQVRLYVDKTLYFTFNNEGTGFAEWPFDKRFHLLLNVAVGGDWGGAMGVDDAIFPRSMLVDYVRVYQKVTR